MARVQPVMGQLAHSSTMAVTVPMGTPPGASFQAMAPTGQTVMVTVPPGVTPGATLNVEYDAGPQCAPMAQPVMAQPVMAQPVMAQPVMAQPVMTGQPVMMQPRPPGMTLQQPGAAWGDQARHLIHQQQQHGPPGAPPGGAYRQVKFCGAMTCMVAVCLVIFSLPPLVCCCPCDQKTVYVAPDGSLWSPEGARINLPFLAQGL